MPVVYEEKPLISDLLKTTENQLWSAGYMSDAVTVNESAETEYEIGMLLGEVTADGKYKISDPDATDGSETVVAIVAENKTVAAATDTSVLAVVNGPGIVGEKALQLGDQTLADATADLEALNPPLKVAKQL